MIYSKGDDILKKVVFLVTMVASLCLFLNMNSISGNNHRSHINQVKLDKWYSGVPKNIRGTWYHNDRFDNENNAYITYGKYTSAGNFFSMTVNEDDEQLFKKEDPNGLLNIKHRYIGRNTYQIKGVSYDTENNQKKSNHYYYSYKVDIFKNKLHFHLGHGVQDYVRKPSFTIIK